MGVCSVKNNKTYPIALTVIYCRINLYLEVALSGMFYKRNQLVLSIRVLNVYDKRRLFGVIIAQLMNMDQAVVKCKCLD